MQIQLHIATQVAPDCLIFLVQSVSSMARPWNYSSAPCPALFCKIPPLNPLIFHLRILPHQKFLKIYFWLFAAKFWRWFKNFSKNDEMKKFLVCLVRMWIVDFLKHAVQCTNQTGYEMMCSIGILTSTECLCSLILLLKWGTNAWFYEWSDLVPSAQAKNSRERFCKTSEKWKEKWKVKTCNTWHNQTDLIIIRQKSENL